ncbi:hypothetical protein ACFXPV_37420 [Streptomyces sp. NPDC059118]
MVGWEFIELPGPISFRIGCREVQPPLDAIDNPIAKPHLDRADHEDEC